MTPKFHALAVLDAAGLKGTDGKTYPPGTRLSEFPAPDAMISAWVRSGQVGAAQTFEALGAKNPVAALATLFESAAVGRAAFLNSSVAVEQLRGQRATALEELSRLQAGEFDPDKLTEKALRERLADLTAQTSTLAARIAAALPKLDDQFAAVRGSRFQAAKWLQSLNDNARAFAAAELTSTLQPLFGAQWHGRLLEDFSHRFGRDTVAQRAIDDRQSRIDALQRFDPRGEANPLPERLEREWRELQHAVQPELPESADTN